MPTPKTIDVTISAALFLALDPRGLRRGRSAQQYLEELKARLRELYPASRMFLRFKPTSSEPVDVFTLPSSPEHAETIRKLAEELAKQRTWIRYDKSNPMPLV